MIKIWSFDYLIILFKLISLFLTAISSNGGDIKHPISEFNKCSPIMKENVSEIPIRYDQVPNDSFRFINLLMGMSKSAM